MNRLLSRRDRDLFARPCGWGVCFSMLLMTGCGGNPDLGTPLDVSGTLTLIGEPLNDVSVIFHTEAEGVPPEARTFRATTDSGGTYRIDRIYPGTYQVMVRPAEEEEPEDKGDMGGPETGPFSRYGMNSPLEAEVSEDKTTFDYDLSRSS